jgi:hypothetical protein
MRPGNAFPTDWIPPNPFAISSGSTAVGEGAAVVVGVDVGDGVAGPKKLGESGVAASCVGAGADEEEAAGSSAGWPMMAPARVL